MIEVVPSSMLDSVHEIVKMKVLLGYLVYSVANTSNAVEFIETYTAMCRKIWKGTWKITFVCKLMQNSQILHEKGNSLTETNSKMKVSSNSCLHIVFLCIEADAHLEDGYEFGLHNP